MHLNLGRLSHDARLMAGIILLTVPTIQYGGLFLLRSLMDKQSGYMDNPLRQNLFRAGHAHAGVFVILALVCQILADSAALPPTWMWLARLGAPIAAILLPLGFFTSMLQLIYAGAFFLAAGVLTLGIGLLRA